FGLGVATSPPPPLLTVLPPLTVQVSPVPTTALVNGAGIFVFPFVSVGLEWFTNLSVGNISDTAQTIRIDFFQSDGTSLGSLTDITIAPRAVFSTPVKLATPF